MSDKIIDEDVRKLPVNLAGHSYAGQSYDIVIGKHLLEKAGEYISAVIKRRYVIIISDEIVAGLYLNKLVASLEAANINSKALIIPPGEGSKSLAGFSALIEQILEQKPSRDAALIALGGGVVGDLTGFAASVCLRGISFIQIPTTLLAQVDSSVGGKTGINSAFGKNMIGSFYQPALVLSDVAVLADLPQRQLLAGYAEILKYALIDDEEFFSWLKLNAAAMLGGDSGLLSQAVMRCCRAKARIVEADEKEQGIRALLNLGHSFAHALEAETGYSEELLHGEAVAIGMIMAFSVSVSMGICAAADLEQIKQHYKAIGLPDSPLKIRKSWNVEALMEHFTRDKKSSAGKLTFILVKGIGKAFIAHDVDGGIIRQSLNTFIAPQEVL